LRISVKNRFSDHAREEKKKKLTKSGKRKKVIGFDFVGQKETTAWWGESLKRLKSKEAERKS